MFTKIFNHKKFFNPSDSTPKFFYNSYNNYRDIISKLIPFRVNNKVYNLPNNCHYHLWGRIIYRDRDILIVKTRDGRFFRIINRGDNFLVTCVVNGIIVLEFVDYADFYYDSPLHYF